MIIHCRKDGLTAGTLTRSRLSKIIWENVIFSKITYSLDTSCR